MIRNYLISGARGVGATLGLVADDKPLPHMTILVLV